MLNNLPINIPGQIISSSFSLKLSEMNRLFHILNKEALNCHFAEVR